VNSLDDAVYDLRGLKCPLPVLKTEKRLRGMSSGTILTVETSDPLAIIDIPHFCNENGHALLSSEKIDKGHRFVIRRG
jgi:tRNA 2-thiouridine synthesizing protein A